MLHSRFAKIIKIRKSALFNINQHYADFLHRRGAQSSRARRRSALTRRLKSTFSNVDLGSEKRNFHSF